jgi:photosystem II stability/assembly factor-like uncharacterized protein
MEGENMQNNHKAKRWVAIRLIIFIFLLLSACGKTAVSPTSISTNKYKTINAIKTETPSFARWTETWTKIQSLTPTPINPIGNNSWVSLGPDGGTVLSLAIDPVHSETIYAGTGHGGIYKSTNSGEVWEVVSGTWYMREIHDLAVDPSQPTTIYAATEFEGVIKSTDGGMTWNPANKGLPSYVDSVVVNPKSPESIYAVTDLKGGLYKSNDGGMSWVAMSNGLRDAYFGTVVVDPTNSYILYAGTNKGVFISKDKGEQWTATGFKSIGIGTLAIDPSNPKILYAGGRSLYKSMDGGDKWVKLSLDLYNGISKIELDPQSSNTVYVLGYEGIYKSINAGRNWSEMDQGLDGSTLRAFEIDPLEPATLYAGEACGRGANNCGGVYKSINGGVGWRVIDEGIQSPNIQALAIFPTDANTLIAEINGGISISTDGGITWKQIDWSFPGLLQIDNIAFDPTNSKILYASTGTLIYSTNGGYSWKLIPDFDCDCGIYVVIVDPSNPATLYAGTHNQGVFKSTDRGITWTNIGLTEENVEHNGEQVVNSLALDPKDPNNIFAGTDWGIMVSKDGGNSWKLMEETIAKEIDQITFDPLRPSTIYAMGAYSVLKSIDDGESWNYIDTNPFPSRLAGLALHPTLPGIIFIGTSDNGVFLSTNDGEQWVQINSGLTFPAINYLVISPATPPVLYAATAGGGLFVLHLDK